MPETLDVAAIAAGDVAEVERTLRRNWQSAGARLRSVIATAEERA